MIEACSKSSLGGRWRHLFYLDTWRGDKGTISQQPTSTFKCSCKDRETKLFVVPGNPGYWQWMWNSVSDIHDGYQEKEKQHMEANVTVGQRTWRGYTILFFEFFKTGQDKAKLTDQMLVIILLQQWGWATWPRVSCQYPVNLFLWCCHSFCLLVAT